MTGPILPTRTSLQPKVLRTICASPSASSGASPWEIKITCFSGSMAVAFMCSSSARMDLARPLAFSIGMRRPSSSTCSTGLIESIVPRNAAAAETRPPRFKWLRSATVNQWQNLPLFFSTQSKFSLRLMPASRLFSTYSTSRPSPIEAHLESATSTFLPGNFASSSSLATMPLW